ncbi:MAG TPA: hypothetical protein VEA16_23035 [Vicinamibacterales bacterium]|nr:hypothetical protein [Vicinamibacterales bacterium]
MKKRLLMFAASMLLAPAVALGQGQGQNDKVATTLTIKQMQEELATAKKKLEEAQAATNPRFVRTLTNVQIELTLTDQDGSGAPGKKTVSMIVSSGNWGKIRSSSDPRMPQVVGLNVDARPFVTMDGTVQLELTLYYYPPMSEVKRPDRPTELNQSLTVVLSSGKPLVISQSADPGGDRKVTVEVKATVLK